MIDQEEIMPIITINQREPFEQQVGPYLHEHENLGSASVRREVPLCLDNYREMEPVIVKQEEIKQQLYFDTYEHPDTELASTRQEPTTYVDEYENFVNDGILTGQTQR